MIYDTSTGATTTTWVDSDGVLWVDSSTGSRLERRDFANEIQAIGRAHRELREPTQLHNYAENPSITYDSEKKKFIVCRGWDYQDKEFTTKRSAQRFVKRWLDKKNGIPYRQKDIVKRYKEAQAHAQMMREMEHNRIELERLYMEQEKAAQKVRLQIELQELDDNYYERLGL